MDLRSRAHLLIDSLYSGSKSLGRRKISPWPIFQGWSSPPLEENPEYGFSERSWFLVPFWLVLLFALFIIVGRLSQLQLFQGKHYAALAEDNRLRRHLVRAERGVIYDAEGQLLASNRPGFRVGVELPKLGLTGGDEHIWQSLGEILGLEESAISEKLEAGRAENLAQVTIASAVSHEQALQVEANLWRWPMVVVEVDPVRYYPLGKASAHVLGYVGEISAAELEEKRWHDYYLGDWVGKTGLEWEYDRYLHGYDGARVFETEAYGRGLAELERQEPRPGLAIQTSLRSDLLKTAYTSLAEIAGKQGALGGAVVVQSASNGEVLALVSYPSYDPNLFASQITESDYQLLLDDSRQPMFDRALGAAYPPGSVFKLITGSGILEEGIISADQVITDEGGISIGPFSFADWKPGGHGQVDFVRALAVSCDTYFYIFGGGYGGYRGLGAEGIAKWARLFGYGVLSGIDVPYEVPGLVPDPEWKMKARGEQWYLGDTYHYAIGQGDLLATPLQVNNMVVAVANGGRLYRPRVVKAVFDGQGPSPSAFPPEIINQNFVSSETLELVREGMRQAVLAGGTAYPLRNFRIECGAKTGTAEFGDPEGKTHAWFTAFCPFDRPEIVATAVLEAGGEGSHHAGPVVRAVMEAYFNDHPEKAI